MNAPDEIPARPESLANCELDEPRLPGFRRWRGVYLLVLASFVLWVALLAALTRAFS